MTDLLSALIAYPQIYVLWVLKPSMGLLLRLPTADARAQNWLAYKKSCRLDTSQPRQS